MATWMLVEDEPDLYEMVLTMYSLMGLDGVSFTTGEEAIEWIEEVEAGEYVDELPELVLLDIRLPGDIDGAMVGERLRESPQLKNIAIVLMTAYKLSLREEEAIIKQAGADFLLYKPLPKLNEFHQLLLEILHQRWK